MGVHAVMGTGGAPEGVLTAAALRCLNGQILARLVVARPEHRERAREDGHQGSEADLRHADLAPGKKIIFACTGVTPGGLLRGVRFFGGGTRTHSLIMTLDEREIRFIDSVHLEKGANANECACDSTRSCLINTRPRSKRWLQGLKPFFHGA